MRFCLAMVIISLAFLLSVPAFAKDSLRQKEFEALLRDANIRICAKNLTRNLFFDVSRRIGLHPSDLNEITKADVPRLRNRFKKEFRKSSETLAKFIHALVVTNDEREIELLKICAKM